MDFGVHLPIVFRGGKPFGLDYLKTFVQEAEALGYKYLAINDHIAYRDPLLDGPTALIAVAGFTTTIRLVPSVLLVNHRGIAISAKMLATLDVLTGGRVIAGIGPGSSDRDAAVAGVNFEERWRRFDEAAKSLRALLHPGAPPFKGKYYSTEGITFEPHPVQQPVLPLWIGSWGSDAGLRRVARLGDGWLASGGDAAPDKFAATKARLDAFLVKEGKDPRAFPNAVSTTMTYITSDRSRIEQAAEGSERGRGAENNRMRSLVGSAGEAIEKLQAWKEAGAQTIYLRPLDDDLDQIRVFMEQVGSRV